MMIGDVATMESPPTLVPLHLEKSSQSTPCSIMTSHVDRGNESSCLAKYSDHSSSSSETESTVEETVATTPASSAVEGHYVDDGASHEGEDNPLLLGEIDCAQLEAVSPPSNKPRNAKLSVKFVDSPIIVAIPGRHEISDETAASMWLSRQELSTMKQNASKLVASMNNKAAGKDVDQPNDDDESDSCCLRGLECYMEESQKRRLKTKKVITKAIIETQKIQVRQGTGQSSLLLAKISRLISQQPRQEALERARSDVEYVLMQSLSELQDLQLSDACAQEDDFDGEL